MALLRFNRLTLGSRPSFGFYLDKHVWIRLDFETLLRASADSLVIFALRAIPSSMLRQ